MEERIVKLLGNCKNGNCTCDLASAFIMDVADEFIYLFDENTDGPEQPFRLVEESEIYQFSVKNNREDTYDLVKVDNCLITTKESRKCDAILYTDLAFFFLELKDVNVKGRAAARSEAIEQLEITVKMFDGFDFEGRDIFAVVGFRTQQPYVVSASKNSKRAMFKEYYNIQLQEGSQIILD